MYVYVCLIKQDVAGTHVVTAMWNSASTAKWIAYQITYLIGNSLSALNTRPIAYPSRAPPDSLSVSLSDRTTCAPPETGEHGEPLSHTHDRARRAHDTREHGGELNLRTAVGAG